MMNDDNLSVDAERQSLVAFQKFWALAACGLIAVTWRLWLPVTDFPIVPVFGSLNGMPILVDQVLLGLMVGGLVVVLGSKRSIGRTIGLLLFAGSMLGMVLLNQHRFQPWAYQFFVFAIVMAFCPPREARRLMSWVTISIYFYSALSKFDYQFHETLGRDFLIVLLKFFGIDPANGSADLNRLLIWLFPAIELVLAIGLTMRWSRRLAGWGIVLMHGSLLLILGPWGLQHQLGVLTWNLYLAGQSLFLFCFAGHGFKNHVSSESQHSYQRTPVRWIANILVGFVIVFPLTATIDICDHWPAWEVYAPRTSRANLELSVAAAEKLPSDLQYLCVASAETIGVVEFQLDQWSLLSLRVPIYPEDRFQFAVGRELTRRYGIRNFRLLIGADSNRWNGERQWNVVDRPEKVEAAAAEFWLNTTARSIH